MNFIIDCSIKESVATIAISHPKAQNAIGTRMSAELKDIRAEIQRDKTVKVVVITGAERDVFCAGTDRKNFTNLKIKPNASRYFQWLPLLIRLIVQPLQRLTAMLWGRAWNWHWPVI